MTYNKEYVRSILFGVEDSLVSTTGLIAGLSVGVNDSRIVVFGAVVAILIESLSMGAGEYLSDDAVQELDKLKRQSENPLVSGLLMFSSYLLAGMVPLVPILMFDLPQALWVSIVLALLGLFLLGYMKGRVLKTRAFQGGLKMFIVGGLAAALGVIVGIVFHV